MDYSVGQKFKYFRDMYRITQEKLSQILEKEADLKYSKSTISRIENDLLKPSLNYTLAFIKVLSSREPKEVFDDKEISIFSFLSNDINDIDKLAFLNVFVLSNAIEKFKNYQIPTYEIPLFETIFDVKKPLFKYLFAFDGTEIFLKDLNPHFLKYKQLNDTKIKYDNMIKKNQKDNIQQKVDENFYKNEITKPMKEEIKYIRQYTFDFIIGFLNYYCNPLKKPTNK